MDRMKRAVERIEGKIKEVSDAIASGEELDQEQWNKGYLNGLEAALSELGTDEGEY